MANSDPFKRAEDEYFRLRGQLATNRITREQFEAALNRLTVEDAGGRRWMLGTASGKWNVYDGAQWVEADPYSGGMAHSTPLPKPTVLPEMGGSGRVGPPPVAPVVAMSRVPAPAPAAASTPRRGGCGGCLLRGCLVTLVVILIAAVGIYFAFQSGAITRTTLLNLAGLGPATISVNNFRDDKIQVNIQQLDTAQGSTPLQGALDLNAFDVKNFTASNPGKYQVKLNLAPTGTPLGECTLAVKSGDEYQFVALPDRIVVNRANNPSTVGTDLIVATSTLCRAQ